jgi:hypothetical protein
MTIVRRTCNGDRPARGDARWKGAPLALGFLLAALALPGPGSEGGRVLAAPADEGRGRAVARTAAGFGADVPTAWVDLMYAGVRTERLSPPVASRIFGYAGVALYEAVVPGMPDHRSLAGQLNGLAALPAFEPHRVYHWPSVANACLAAAVRGLFAGASASTLAAIDALEGRFDAEFTSSTPPPVRARSVAQGRAVAAAVLAWASGDGFAANNNCAYTPPVGEGLWVPTLPLFRPALQPCWGRLRPLALPAADACAPPAPPAYSTDTGSAFYAEGREVYDVGNSLTAEQREIALFWADNAGETGTPPGHSMSIATQVIRDRSSSLDVAAEAYARVGLAVADGFISCWQTKYVHNLLRPITYVEQVIGDPAWRSFIPTPPFPEYTSGHSVQSRASAEVLTDLFGAIAFTDATHVDRGFAPRRFDSFFAAAREAAVSRLYGGIHFRAAIDRGVEQGICVGRTILDGVRFRAEDEEGDR